MNNAFRANLVSMLLAGLSLFLASAEVEAQEMKPASTLIQNVNIFDGKNEKLIENASVLIEGNLIKQVSTTEISAEGATVIDGKGSTLMPGLIDAHWHTMLSFWPVGKVLTSDIATLSLAAAKAHKETLLRGFTTVRDAGGAAIPIAKAVNSGLIDGPRMYPSGPVIGQTSGHSDWRNPLNIPEEKNQPLDYSQKSGQTLIADGVPEVMKRTREVLRMGASQVRVRTHNQ